MPRDNIELLAKRIVTFLKSHSLGHQLPLLISRLIELNSQSEHIEVTYASPLTELQKNNINHDLSSRFPQKKIVFKKDPSLYYGFKIKFKDLIFDGSLRQKIERFYAQN